MYLGHTARNSSRGNKAMMMVAPAVLLLLLSVMVIQPVRATPVPFTMIKKNAEWIDVTNSAPSSRADSASAARSQNNVKCFAFCSWSIYSWYSKGYVDGQRDFKGLNGHGFDDILRGKHTAEFRTGYADGYRTGFDDAVNGKNLNPC
jgi:hypothetical protein